MMSDTVPVPADLIAALREAVKEWDSSDQVTGWPASTVCSHARALIDATEPQHGHPEGWTCNCVNIYPPAPPVQLADTPTARELPHNVGEAVCAAPQVVPTNDGGIQLEWHRCGVDIEIQVAADGDIRGWWDAPDPEPPALSPGEQAWEVFWGNGPDWQAVKDAFLAGFAAALSVSEEGKP